MSNQQIQQDIQNEVIITNQLLRSISIELHHIKCITAPGGILESNVQENMTHISKLVTLQHIDIENLPPVMRQHTPLTDQNISYDEMLDDSNAVHDVTE